MERRFSIFNGSPQTAIPQAQPTQASIRDSFKVRRRQPVVTVVKIVAKDSNSTVTTKESIHNSTKTGDYLESTLITKNARSRLFESTAKKPVRGPQSSLSSISSPSTFVKPPPSAGKIPPVSGRTRNKNALPFAAAVKNDSNFTKCNAEGAKKQEAKMTDPSAGPTKTEGHPSRASGRAVTSRFSKKSPHDDPSQPSQEARISSQLAVQLSPGMVAEYLREKAESIRDLRILRDSLRAKRELLDRKTAIFKEQAAITAGILEKEAEVWKYGGPLGSSCALLEHQLKTLMTKQVAMEKLQNDIKERISQIIRLIVSGEERSADAEVKQSLALQTPLKLEGSRHLAQLIEDAIAAKTNFSAAEEDTFIHVGHGKYYPPLVCALVSVGILRFHEEDPTRVVLNCKLGRN